MLSNVYFELYAKDDIYENDKLIYEKDTLHRMFSMTKTLVSLGIGKLYGEGKLSLDDHIVDYFKDKLPKEALSVFCLFDNEEVGSGTRQGAASTFLRDTLLRINLGLGRSYEDYLISLAKSFMISADNAHAIHPNYPEKADPVNRPHINAGIAVKYNANQKYCTDGISAAMFKELCKEAGVSCQVYVNRSDVAGGSTLGNISNTQVALNTVDIGLPQLAMHSPYETAGVKDTCDFVKLAGVFYA